MATNQLNSLDAFDTWLHNSRSLLKRASEAVFIGYGDNIQLNNLLELYPHLEITIVDPESESKLTSASPLSARIKYVKTEIGLETLKKHLSMTKDPVPVFCFKESWRGKETYFLKTQRFLLGLDDMSLWAQKPAHFILGSLFV
ncbi:MAG: hypothetical protein RJB66_2035 [Pseudomonadota bacterium]|jgi:hypothetical protein